MCWCAVKNLHTHSLNSLIVTFPPEEKKRNYSASNKTVVYSSVSVAKSGSTVTMRKQRDVMYKQARALGQVRDRITSPKLSPKFYEKRSISRLKSPEFNKNRKKLPAHGLLEPRFACPFKNTGLAPCSPLPKNCARDWYVWHRNVDLFALMFFGPRTFHNDDPV